MTDNETPLIIQGSNNPLIIEFSESVADIPKLIVTLWGSFSDEPIKKWEKADIVFTENYAICPLTEDETAGMAGYQANILVKGLDINGFTIFWNAYNIDILYRQDKIYKLTQVGG